MGTERIYTGRESEFALEYKLKDKRICAICGKEDNKLAGKGFIFPAFKFWVLISDLQEKQKEKESWAAILRNLDERMKAIK